jgi:hypothetical protein
MKIIDINNLVSLGDLKKGELAFPELDFSQYSDLNLNSTTLMAAHTVISSRVEPRFLVGLEWEENGDIQWQNAKLGVLASEVKELISEYLREPNDFTLIQIFLWIQLWGGNAGRTIFVRGNGWSKNFNINCYRDSINLIEKGQFVEALKMMNTMFGINTAFSTKHVHFWSLANAPIYDSIIAEIVFGDLVKEKDYNRYLGALDALIAKLGNNEITRSTIERNLFNWANTNAGKEWRRLRKLNRTKRK